jgi:hypothetical protein
LHASSSVESGAEWAASPHAKKGSVPFTYWDNKKGDIPVACAGCHSTHGFLDLLGADGSTPGNVGLSAGESEALRQRLPDALAVEMEGAALAQVCFDFGIPFAVVRTVSDRADDSAHVDFLRFVDAVASRYTVEIVRRFLRDFAP